MPEAGTVRPCRKLRRPRLGTWSTTGPQCMPPGGPGGPKTICHIQMRKPYPPTTPTATIGQMPKARTKKVSSSDRRFWRRSVPLVASKESLITEPVQVPKLMPALCADTIVRYSGTSKAFQVLYGYVSRHVGSCCRIGCPSWIEVISAQLKSRQPVQPGMVQRRRDGPRSCRVRRPLMARRRARNRPTPRESGVRYICAIVNYRVQSRHRCPRSTVISACVESMRRAPV